MTSNTWKKLSSKIVYKTPWFKVREDNVIKPDGKKGIYSVVETNGNNVMIIALTDKNEVYLIKQHRHTTSSNKWEIPGGNTDGQDELTAAKRELIEETGLIAKDWEKIGMFQTMNGVSSEHGIVFVAKNIRQTRMNKMEEEGITDIKKVPFELALKMIKNAQITDGQSIVALAKVALIMNKL